MSRSQLAGFALIAFNAFRFLLLDPQLGGFNVLRRGEQSLFLTDFAAAFASARAMAAVVVDMRVVLLRVTAIVAVIAVMATAIPTVALAAGVAVLVDTLLAFSRSRPRPVFSPLAQILLGFLFIFHLIHYHVLRDFGFGRLGFHRCALGGAFFSVKL